jgi:hypothetical protein
MSEPCPRNWELCHRSYCARNQSCAERDASAPAPMLAECEQVAASWPFPAKFEQINEGTSGERPGREASESGGLGQRAQALALEPVTSATQTAGSQPGCPHPTDGEANG